MEKLAKVWSVRATSMILRLWLGAMMMWHGQRKVFGDIDRFAESVAEMGFPLPRLFALAAAYSEFLGGFLILIGLFTRPALGFVLITMLVAAFIAHGPDPFSKKELALTFASMSMALLALGPGKWSIDAMLYNRSARKKRA